jgi:G3E family GTPase
MCPIPITVFTGYLGAGKTSIILSLLPRLPENYRVVLLKNEFGDLEGLVVVHPNENIPDHSQSGQQAGAAIEPHSCQ